MSTQLLKPSLHPLFWSFFSVLINTVGQNYILFKSDLYFCSLLLYTLQYLLKLKFWRDVFVRGIYSSVTVSSFYKHCICSVIIGNIYFSIILFVLQLIGLSFYSFCTFSVECFIFTSFICIFSKMDWVFFIFNFVFSTVKQVDSLTVSTFLLR